MSEMRRLLIACAVVLALPVASWAADNPVVAAAKRTTAAKTSTFQMAFTMTVPGQGTATIAGTGAQRGSDVKMSLRMRSGGVSFRMDAVLVREGGAYVMYMRSPLFRSQLPRGKSWIRVNLSKQASTLGFDFSSLASVSQTLAPLEKGIVSTKRVGSEVVAGTATTRYRAIIDVRRAARAIPDYGKQIAALDRATGVRLGRVPWDVWVASDRRIRRLRFAMPTGEGARAKSTQSITFLSFNTPVTIAAPPRSHVLLP
jgi:hypothetical protein